MERDSWHRGVRMRPLNLCETNLSLNATSRCFGWYCYPNSSTNRGFIMVYIVHQKAQRPAQELRNEPRAQWSAGRFQILKVKPSAQLFQMWG